MIFSFRYLAIGVLVLVSSTLFSQNKSVKKDSTSAIRIKSQVDGELVDRDDFTVIPILFYTPETTVGFGVGGQGTFYTKGSSVRSRPSSLFFSGVYTARNQLLITAEPKIYFDNESFLLEGKFLFKVFPDYFWGIGNESKEAAREDFNMQSTILKVSFLRKLKPYVNFGFEYEFNHYKMLEYVEDGTVESSDYFGEETLLSGLGISINFDSRDNYQAPKGGAFYSLKTGVASRAMGSTTAFNFTSIDIRRYFKLNKTRQHATILAFQAYLNTTTGDVPFQRMSRYGGSIYARGYYLGRYTDNNMFVLQSEVRSQLKGKWSIAAFAIAGDVFLNTGDLGLSQVKSSLGGGLRWQIRKSDPSLLRLDFAYGFATKGTGVYFGVNEAF